MIVSTKLGKIKGVDFDTYIEYRHVPYAKPPVGNLRWKAPVPVEAWDGIWDATQYGNRCMAWDMSNQLYDKEFYDSQIFKRTMGEDCLYINIWTPKDFKNKKYPVAFWIHGGAFATGYATEKEFDGKAYCERNVCLLYTSSGSFKSSG